MKLASLVITFTGFGNALAFGKHESSILGVQTSRETNLMKSRAFIDKEAWKRDSASPLHSIPAGGEGATSSFKTLFPSGIFLLFAAMLAKVASEIYSSDIETTIGTLSLLFTTVAVGYDNFIIGLGKPFFGDVATNELKRKILKVLSYPRFTAHAVLLPFLFVTAGEIGKGLNISWLESSLAQTILIVAATVLGIVSRVRFVQSPGIELADTSDSVPNALERDLVWFTYKEPEFLYVLPAILLSLFTIVVGGVGFFGEGSKAGSVWIALAGVTSLIGNALPSNIMRFTGNLAEISLLWCIHKASKITLK